MSDRFFRSMQAFLLLLVLSIQVYTNGLRSVNVHVQDQRNYNDFHLNTYKPSKIGIKLYDELLKMQGRLPSRTSMNLHMAKNSRAKSTLVEDVLSDNDDFQNKSRSLAQIGNLQNPESDNIQFPEWENSGIDEKALRKSLFGKVLFGILDTLFPVFKEPNWFDVYDPPLSPEANLELPYFDGYDFVNSSWTMYIRHRYGAWNWLDRMGLVPQATQKVFLRQDGKTMWNDGFYGEWYINPAINYFQLEKHYGRGYGYTQAYRGIRIFQIQRWNFEEDIGRFVH